MSRTRSGSFAKADSRAAQRSNDPAQRKARRRSRSAGYSEAHGRSRRPRLRAHAREAARQPPSPPERGARRLRGRLPAEASSQPCAAIASASIAPPRPREVPSCSDPTPVRAQTRGSFRVNPLVGDAATALPWPQVPITGLAQSLSGAGSTEAHESSIIAIRCADVDGRSDWGATVSSWRSLALGDMRDRRSRRLRRDWPRRAPRRSGSVRYLAWRVVRRAGAASPRRDRAPA
jgi:hypothetical protein